MEAISSSRSSSEGGGIFRASAAFHLAAAKAEAVTRKSAAASAIFFFLLLLPLAVVVWINGSSSAELNLGAQEPPQVERSLEAQPKPITLNCPSLPVCRISPSPPSPPLPSGWNRRRPPSCPQYFRWIHEDLRPWSSTGISREMLEGARPFATFRLLVLDGRRVYVEKFRGTFQTRDVFTIWGILQLVARYPGRLPDLELMFDCDDFPAVRTAAYPLSPPPPVFHYCKDNKTSDILFPDWSFWGWPETKIKPWNTLMEELKEGNEKMKWSDRIPYAFWKGNPMMGPHRQDLMKCNASADNGTDWSARLYTQDWWGEMIRGFNNSNLASQCQYRYKIFVEGISWSVSQKYILACDSPALFITPHFYEFFSRSLMPGHHYWPIQENHKCSSIKFAVDWGNKHQKEVYCLHPTKESSDKIASLFWSIVSLINHIVLSDYHISIGNINRDKAEAQALGKDGSRFVMEELKMDYVYDYMLHSLTQYAKLLRFKPAVPENATEVCMESVACEANGRVKEFMLESMVRSTQVEEPCAIPPPFTPVELLQLLGDKSRIAEQVEKQEKNA